MGDGILMKFDIWKDIVFQSSYFKSRPDLVIWGRSLGELAGGPINLGERLKWRDRDETWWEK